MGAGIMKLKLNAEQKMALLVGACWALGVAALVVNAL